MLKYTRFEVARIIGARSLQIAMGAPVLLELAEGLVDPLRIAEREFNKEVLPISVKRDAKPKFGWPVR